MFDLPNLIEFKKARNALAQGRLEEAFAIAIDERHRDFRQCQELLHALVPAFLARAREHLAGARFDDALADVGRAQTAGGNQVEVAALREEVLARRRTAGAEHRELDDVARSVHVHLDAGRLTEGAARLDAAPRSDPRTEALDRELRRRRLETDNAGLQIGRLLEAGDVEAALDSALVLTRLARAEPQTQAILGRVARASDEALLGAFDGGFLSRAAAMLAKLRDVAPPGFAPARWDEVLRECRQAATDVARAHWSRARVHLGRLVRLLPNAAWVAEADECVRAIADSEQHIASGPLGALASSAGTARSRVDDRSDDRRDGRGAMERFAPPADDPASAAAPNDRRSPSPARRAAAIAPSERYVLWVDGVGSYLLLSGERTTIGRIGSSALADIALAGDIEGVHAEILRVEHDWFLVPRAPTRVGGRAVERHLLADGDRIELSQKVRLDFRLPTSLSSSAVIELPRDQRLPCDARRVILLDGNLILGATTACHVITPDAAARVVLRISEDTFHCHASQGVAIDGRDAGSESTVPLGAHVTAGKLSFTITQSTAGGPWTTARANGGRGGDA